MEQFLREKSFLGVNGKKFFCVGKFLQSGKVSQTLKSYLDMIL